MSYFCLTCERVHVGQPGRCLITCALAEDGAGLAEERRQFNERIRELVATRAVAEARAEALQRERDSEQDRQVTAQDAITLKWEPEREAAPAGARMKGFSWSASAKTGATGNIYEIRTIADFLKVPEDRRRICLREFNAWLSLHASVPALVYAAVDALGSSLPPESIRISPNLFRWIDDGKATITVKIQPGKRDSV